MTILWWGKKVMVGIYTYKVVMEEVRVCSGGQGLMASHEGI